MAGSYVVTYNSGSEEASFQSFAIRVSVSGDPRNSIDGGLRVTEASYGDENILATADNIFFPADENSTYKYVNFTGWRLTSIEPLEVFLAGKANWVFFLRAQRKKRASRSIQNREPR